jgi:hypothetical protein
MHQCTPHPHTPHPHQPPIHPLGQPGKAVKGLGLLPRKVGRRRLKHLQRRPPAVLAAVSGAVDSGGAARGGCVGGCRVG